MRAVDTNVLVRLLVRDDRVQVAAAEDFVAAGAWISHLVLAETVWVLDAVYGAPRRRIATAVEMLLDHRDLAVEDPETVAAALAIFRKRTKIGFSDSLVLAIAQRAGHEPLGTFDRELGKCAGARRL
jgi:predicted nucleic-acid-binding protein